MEVSQDSKCTEVHIVMPPTLPRKHSNFFQAANSTAWGFRGASCQDRRYLNMVSKHSFDHSSQCFTWSVQHATSCNIRDRHNGQVRPTTKLSTQAATASWQRQELHESLNLHGTNLYKLNKHNWWYITLYYWWIVWIVFFTEKLTCCSHFRSSPWSEGEIWAFWLFGWPGIQISSTKFFRTQIRWYEPRLNTRNREHETMRDESEVTLGICLLMHLNALDIQHVYR